MCWVWCNAWCVAARSRWKVDGNLQVGREGGQAGVYMYVGGDACTTCTRGTSVQVAIEDLQGATCMVTGMGSEEGKTCVGDQAQPG